jgi:disulfide bond formation protein DsbB
MHNFIIENITPVFVLLTYVLNVATVVLLYALVFRKQNISKKILEYVGDMALKIGFVVSLGAFLGSIMYSNIVGFEPCFLCWWERIFLYPLVFIYGVGLYVKEKSVWIYSFVFSVIAVMISGYHSYIRLAGSESALCVESAVSCTKQYVSGYGYVNIPTMALSTGIFILLITIIYKLKYNKGNEK